MSRADDAMESGFTVEDILGDALTSEYIDDAYYQRLRQDLTEWDSLGKPLTEAERQAYEALILHENWLLDRRAFEQWYQLYTPHCCYWVPSVHDMPNAETGDPQTQVTIAFDDRRRMGDRIVWLRTGVAYSQLPPSYTCHVGSGFVRVATSQPDEVKIRSQFIVHEMRAGHAVQALTGWMGHVLVNHDGRLKIDRKLVCLLDAQRSHHNLTFLL